MRATETVGQRIRRFRKDAGLTQKELAERVKVNESTIRNYELGNRFPEFNTLFDISLALNMNYHALAGVQLEEPLGAMLALYYMEDIYGLHPVKVGDIYHLAFRDEPIPENYNEKAVQDAFQMDSMLEDWYYIRQEFLAGKITEEEYFKWQEKGPFFSSYDWENERMLFGEESANFILDMNQEKEPQPEPKEDRKRVRKNRVAKTEKE